MPLFTKPQFNSVWASTGTTLTPDSGKISTGWVVEIPPYEFDNWIQNRQDALLAHINQLGVPMWDATVEYQAGKSYIQGITSGVIYRAVTTNTNVNPELDIQGNWVVAFQASGQALLKSQNLADVPNKTLARQNLGIPETVFYDGRYLQQSNNLADVPNKATARNNLGLGNSSVLNVGTTSSTVAAGNDSRIVNAAPNSRVIVAGNGLVGGGDLTTDCILSLGTPSGITKTSGNTVSGVTHTHALDIDGLFPNQKDSTGYTELPNGFIFQGGYVEHSTKNTGVSVVFPKRFPFRTITITLTTVSDGSIHVDGGYQVTTRSVTGFTAFLQEFNADTGTAGMQGFYWFAMGH